MYETNRDFVAMAQTPFQEKPERTIPLPQVSLPMPRNYVQDPHLGKTPLYQHPNKRIPQFHVST